MRVVAFFCLVVLVRSETTIYRSSSNKHFLRFFFRHNSTQLDDVPGLFCPRDDNPSLYPEQIDIELTDVQVFLRPVPAATTTTSKRTTTTTTTDFTTTSTVFIPTTANGTTTTSTTTIFATEPNEPPVFVGGRPPPKPPCNLSAVAGGFVAVFSVAFLVSLYYFFKRGLWEATLLSSLTIFSIITCTILTGYRHCLTDDTRVARDDVHGAVWVRVSGLGGVDIAGSPALRTDLPFGSAEIRNFDVQKISFQTNGGSFKEFPYNGPALFRRGMNEKFKHVSKRDPAAVGRILSTSSILSEAACLHEHIKDTSANDIKHGIVPYFERSLRPFAKQCLRKTPHFMGAFCAGNTSVIIFKCFNVSTNTIGTPP